MNQITINYEGKDIEFRTDGKDAWLTQKEIADMYESNRGNISRYIRQIYKDGELDKALTVVSDTIVQQEGDRTVTREVEHYNLDVIIAVGYRVGTQKGTKFRKWATSVLATHLTQGVTVNPALASRDPEQVQDNFYAQMSPYMKHHLNQHAHTEEYRIERLKNTEERKQLTHQLSRTIDGTINYGKIMGLFHISLTGKTKSQLLAEYEHARTTTTAIDTLGSLVVNQINVLMQSVRLVLESYPDDYIPSDVHTAQLERIVQQFAKNLRAHLDTLSRETGQPIERLGENTYKNRLI